MYIGQKVRRSCMNPADMLPVRFIRQKPAKLGRMHYVLLEHTSNIIVPIWTKANKRVRSPGANNMTMID